MSRFIRANACEKRSASCSWPLSRMIRTRVNASSSSLLIGRWTSSRQVKRCRSSGVPLMLVRSSATEQPPARFCAALFFSGEGLRLGCRSGDDGVSATHGHPIHGPAEQASPRSDEADSGGAVNGLVAIYFASRMFDLRGCFLVMPVDTGNPLGDIDMANNQNNQ